MNTTEASTCPDLNLLRYACGESDAAEAAAVEAHVASCEACARELGGFEWFQQALEAAPSLAHASCPAPDALVALIFDGASAPGAEETRRHAASCSSCAEELERLEAFQRSPEPEAAAEGPTLSRSLARTLGISTEAYLRHRMRATLERRLARAGAQAGKLRENIDELVGEMADLLAAEPMLVRALSEEVVDDAAVLPASAAAEALLDGAAAGIERLDLTVGGVEVVLRMRPGALSVSARGAPDPSRIVVEVEGGAMPVRQVELDASGVATLDGLPADVPLRIRVRER